MDYSNIPELKKSIESATPAMVQSTLDASNGKPTKDKAHLFSGDYVW